MLIYLLFQNSKCCLVNYCDLKTLGLIDMACTNAEFRIEWLLTLKTVRLCRSRDKLINSLKHLRFAVVFREWIFKRQSTPKFAELCFPNHIEKETNTMYELDLTQSKCMEEEDNKLTTLLYNVNAEDFYDEKAVNEEDEDEEEEEESNNSFTNDQIVSELLKRSCTNLHTELNFLVKSVLRLSNKMELCVKAACECDSLMFRRTTTEMCAIAVEASQMTSIASSRFSQYINRLLVSTFADEAHPNLELLVSASSNYNAHYVGVGVIESWSTMEDSELRKLCNVKRGSFPDILTITANMNLR
jgi:hypothetical protein